MKKILTIMFFLSSLILIACGPKNVKGLIINKLLTANEINKGLVEIKNTSDKDVNLKDYNLTLYKRGDIDEANDINLSGVLKKNEVYLIAVEKSSHEEELKNKINLETDEFKRDGHCSVAITQKGKIKDIVGYLGADTDFSSRATLVRFKGCDFQRAKFKETDYCYLKAEYYDTFLKNEEYNYDEILKGPKFDETKLLSNTLDNYKKFVNDIKTNNNTGELIKVSVSRFVDGDTTYFNELRATIDSEECDYNKVRYQGMDTPESQKTKNISYEPYGKVASAVTKYILEHGKSIYAQISGEGPTLDSYNRSLLLIWTDKVLLPFALVKNGLARFRFDNVFSTEIYYNNISLYNYIVMASFYAKEHKLNIYSGKNSDDTYNYKTEEYKPGVSESTIDPNKYANLKEYNSKQNG